MGETPYEANQLERIASALEEIRDLMILDLRGDGWEAERYNNIRSAMRELDMGYKRR